MASRITLRGRLVLFGTCLLSCFTIGLGVWQFPDFGQPNSAAVLAAAEPNTNSAPTVRILRVLDRPTTVDWIDMSLRDCLQYMREYHGIELSLDDDALEAAKVPLNVHVTLKAEGVTLRSVLRLLLDPLALDFLVENGEIIVTTREIAKAHLYEFSYEIGDAVKAGVPLAALIEAIAQTVERPSWQANGGPGSLRGRERTLFVRQRLVVHERIRDFVDELMWECNDDTAANGDAWLETDEYDIGDLQAAGLSNDKILQWLCEFLLVENSPKFSDSRLATIEGNTLILKQPAWVQQGAAEFFRFLNSQNRIPNYQVRRDSFEMARNMLPLDVKRRITSKLLAQSCAADFRGLPLEDVLLYLRDTSQMNFYVDAQEIKRAEVVLHAPVTLKLDEEPVTILFEKTLEPQGLDWYLREPGLIVVTSRAKAAARMEPRVYRIKKLLADGETEPDLVKQITAAVAPESWTTSGGPGAVHPLPGLLVVVHSRRVHEQVSRFLARMDPGRK